MADKTRRTPDARDAAERAFKVVTTKAPELPKKASLPNAKELVSLRLDREVLEHFQEQGPGGKIASMTRCERQSASNLSAIGNLLDLDRAKALAQILLPRIGVIRRIQDSGF